MTIFIIRITVTLSLFMGVVMKLYRLVATFIKCLVSVIILSCNYIYNTCIDIKH